MALQPTSRIGGAARERAAAVVGAVILAATLSLAADADTDVNGDAGAKFAHIKRTIVPASRFQRHFDDGTMSDDSLSASPSSSGSSYSSSGSYSASHASGKSGKYGLIPPPPPLTPTVMPGGLPGMPGALTMSSASGGVSAGTAQAGNFANAKHVTADPKSASASKYSTSSSSASTKYITADPKSASPFQRVQAKTQPLLKNGNYAAAQSVLETFNHAYPKDRNVRMELSRVAGLNAEKQMANNPEAAATIAREALRANPSNAQAKQVLAQALRNGGIKADSSEDRVKVGDRLYAQGRSGEAEVEYNEALKIKPDADAYVGLGNLAAHQGKHDLAKLEYQKALETNPNSEPALRQMGVLRLEQGDVVGANTDLSRALVLNSADADASKELVGLWQKQIERNPSQANGHLGLARAYLLSGNLQSAQSEYRQVVRLDPQNPNLPAARQSFKLALTRQEALKDIETAKTLAASGQLVDAHQKASDAVELCPGNIQMRLYQAQLSQQLGLTSEARESYTSVLRQDPKNADALAGLQSLPPAASGMQSSDSPALLTPISQSVPTDSPALYPSVSIPPVAPSINAGTVTSTPMGLAASAGSLAAGAAPSAAGATASATTSGAAPPYQSTASPATSLPAAPYPQSPTSSLDTSPHVAALSNFISQVAGLANLVQVQANQMSGLTPSASAPTLGAAGGLNGLSAGTGCSQSAVSQALSNLPSASDLPAVDSSSVSNTLAQAAAALQAAGKPSTASTSAAAAVSSSPQSGVTAGGGLANAASPSSAASSAQAPATPPNLLQMAAQNANARAQAGAPPITISSAQVAQLAQQYGPMLQKPNGQPMSQQDIAALYQRYRKTLEQRYNVQLPPTFDPGAAPALAPPAVSATSAAASFASPPPASPGGTANLSAPLRGPIPTVPDSAVALATSPIEPAKLELVGVQPTPMDIHLKVVLRNQQTVPLKVPNGVKAVVKMNGKERLAKVTFPGDTVPPGGQLSGLIKVSGHDLNPSADVWLPNMLPGSGVDRDLHLTVPISSL